jgi:hypothetical protein
MSCACVRLSAEPDETYLRRTATICDTCARQHSRRNSLFHNGMRIPRRMRQIKWASCTQLEVDLGVVAARSSASAPRPTCDKIGAIVKSPRSYILSFRAPAREGRKDTQRTLVAGRTRPSQTSGGPSERAGHSTHHKTRAIAESTRSYRDRLMRRPAKNGAPLPL